MARNLDEEKRKRILDSAQQCFQEEKIEKVSIKKIAAKAEVATGTVYTYFKNKKELLWFTVKASIENFAEKVRKRNEKNETYEDLLGWIIDYGFDILKKLQPILKKLNLYNDRKDLFDAIIQNTAEQVTKIISEKQKTAYQDLFDSPERKRFLIEIIISGIIYPTSLVPANQVNEMIEKQKHSIKEGFYKFSLYGESA